MVHLGNNWISGKGHKNSRLGIWFWIWVTSNKAVGFDSVSNRFLKRIVVRGDCNFVESLAVTIISPEDYTHIK